MYKYKDKLFMNINSIDNTQFGAIFRIKNTPENKSAIEHQIMPLYRALRNKPIVIFSGMNPFRDAFVAMGVKTVAENEKYSEDWVLQNAEAHGIDIKENANDILHVITGDDCLNLVQYLKKYMADHFSKNNFFKRLKLSFNLSKKIKSVQSENIPKHLLPLLYAFEENEQESRIFQKEILKNREIKTYDNVNELLNAIMLHN